VGKRFPKTYCEAGVHQKVLKIFRVVDKRLPKNLIVRLKFTKKFRKELRAVVKRFLKNWLEFTKLFPKCLGLWANRFLKNLIMRLEFTKKFL
jgi:hypothetical protein